MLIPRKVTLSTFRNDPYHLRMRVNGYDLSAADFKFSVRLLPDTGGSPLAEVIEETVIATSGVRVVDTGTEDDVPYTDIEVFIDLADSDWPAADEPGDDVILSYDFGWTDTPETEGFYNPRATYLYGDFIVKGSVND